MSTTCTICHPEIWHIGKRESDTNTSLPLAVMLILQTVSFIYAEKV